MTTFARVPVVPGPVLEVFVGNQLFPMHASIASTFRACPDGVQQGWNYDGTTFTAPVAVTPNPLILARLALAESDITILRCAENGVAVPSAWAGYRHTLRAIIGGAGTALPNKPEYPEGT